MKSNPTNETARARSRKCRYSRQYTGFRTYGILIIVKFSTTTVTKMLNSLFLYTVKGVSALLSGERTGHYWNNTPILTGEPIMNVRLGELIQEFRELQLDKQAVYAWCKANRSRKCD